MNRHVLPAQFFQRPSVVQVARELLGKLLVTEVDGHRTVGRVVETEAYAANDQASHAHLSKRTNRTEPMFALGGTAYVYLCYGIHHLFNVSTNVAGIAEAVLLRALEPLEGEEIMSQRRRLKPGNFRITAGPGALTQALGIGKGHNGKALPQEEIWFEDDGFRVDEGEIIAGTRVGVAYAKEDAYLPYRFWIRGNKWVSRAKGLIAE
jgi:DNA-3-methyladenine glycosylase